ncbi:ATP-grasp ribosomal peptide maturase [Streptomyces kronopolitis]|uniref:ATP-grasp ribosomal peptide maturase n=1 Tax=Streptomyces kronopolitis TaxID=1612435 RepID=UPI0020C0DF51|nr:ATP-grasp ribosomal peptide maturase [Streptomyces kronopolitis]MCL6302938.1 ATP-grasp ribosomal peptide maturase [Streptomyces kronopolitis]
MPSILVVAAREDWPTDRVVKTLTDRGQQVFRIDASDFPQEATLTGYMDNVHKGWTGSLRTSHRSLDLHDVAACYFRAPNPFRLSPDMSQPERAFAAAQARAGFGGILNALSCRWVNHPWAMSRAEYKPVQLAAAQLVGLPIPRTLITNNPDEVRAFARRIAGPIICKPVASPVFIEANELKTVYTKRLTEADLDDLRGIETTAHLFQEWVDKAHEVRLTVVGERLFATEVHATSPKAHEDWRSDYKSLKYTPTEVPSPLKYKVLGLMRDLNLSFGALDFIVSPHGEWTFLEINPCGQWDWIEHATGLPIADAIADELQGVIA